MDLAKVNLSGISAAEFPAGVGSKETINLLTHGNISQGIVYGRLDFTYLGKTFVTAIPNDFNF